jgi:multidrug efflux pump subunit AcrA (membrane-fusion protein)
MTTTTKTKLPTAQELADAAQQRLDKANADSAAAEERLTALRERQIAHGDVSAENFAAAGAAVELADLDRQGAEADFAEARQAARLDKLAEIRADIEVRADPASAAAAFERAADALAALIREIGPARLTLVSGWARQLLDLGIEPAPGSGGGLPEPENDGFAWRMVPGGGRVGSVSWTASDGEGRTVRAAFDMPVILASLVSRACRAADAPAQPFELGRGYQPLTEDPREWFRAHG